MGSNGDQVLPEGEGPQGPGLSSTFSLTFPLLWQLFRQRHFMRSFPSTETSRLNLQKSRPHRGRGGHQEEEEMEEEEGKMELVEKEEEEMEEEKEEVKEKEEKKEMEEEPLCRWTQATNISSQEL